MRTKEELKQLVNSDKLNESRLTPEEFKLVGGDDFDSVEKFLTFTRMYKEEFTKMAEYCEKNMKRDLDL